MKPSEQDPSDFVVYRDERFTLGQVAGQPYLIADGVRLTLSCHPYEPCLYITDANGCLTAVRNAFDPAVVLAQLGRGEPVRSITGREYDAVSFCLMVAFAAGRGTIGIDDAERVFGCQKEPAAPQQKDNAHSERFLVSAGDGDEDDDRVIESDPLFEVLAAYPDLAVDYALVQSRSPHDGYRSHLRALGCACRWLFASDDEEEPWRYDLNKAHGSLMEAASFFTARGSVGSLTYRTAFLSPPYPQGYTERDYERVNAALFPNGTDALEVVVWNTDWSDYFDSGHEWWGTLCATVYDKTVDRTVVILASATD